MINNPLLLSPPIPVAWAGFTSDTRRMQACGWEFQVEANLHRFSRTLVAKHRDFNTMLWAEVRDAEVERRALAYVRGEYDGYRGPPIMFQRAAHPDSVRMSIVGAVDFRPVDMNSSFADISTWSGHAVDLFRPWAPQAQELIVDPNDVSALFERIKALQSPQLAEIRERNRKRDLREQRQEQVVAQVITLAA